jgi:hypothetical protein
MDQRSFDFTNNDSHPHYLLLDRDRQQSLIELMSTLITQVFNEQENRHYDQSQQPSQDQR